MKYQYPDNVKFDPSSDQQVFFKNVMYKYFKLEELLNEHILSKYGDLGLQFIKLETLKTYYYLRTYYNSPVHVNNYLHGGDLRNRCVRFPDCPEYSKTSEHAVIIDTNGKIIKRSGAGDCTIEGKTAEWVRNDIVEKMYITPFKLITRLEDNVGWLHFDNKILTGGQVRIYQFNNKG